MYFAFGEHAFLGYWPVPGSGTAWFANLPYGEPLCAEQARATPPAAWMRILREKFAGDVPGRDLVLPEQGWGSALLHRTRPSVGKQWTDSGETHDDRGVRRAR